MDTANITQLLNDAEDGDAAVRSVFPYVYPVLRDLASGYLRQERSGHTLQTADLVHEVFLKMVDQPRVKLKGRKHFFVVAATAMRRYLVDYARQKNASKRDPRGAEWLLGNADSSVDLLQLHEAIDALAKLDTQQAQIVELKFFGGLTGDEIGEVLGMSKSSVSREWWLAKQWLKVELA